MALDVASAWAVVSNKFVKEIIQEGSGLNKPNEGASCKLNITPSTDLPDAVSIVGYPVKVECEICLGTGIGYTSSAFDKCMESMRAGEKCRLTFKETPEASSADDCEWTFVIHLIEFSRGKDASEMTTEEKLVRAGVLKELGTKCFKQAMIQQAELFYLRGLKYVIAIGKQDDNTLKLLLSLNIAACQLKQKQYQGVIVHCTNALSIDGDSAKALFRRGQAFMELQDYEYAKSDFERCLELEPNNKAVQSRLELLSEKMKKLDAHYANALSKMFASSTGDV